jgi:hypothetical protein
VKGKNMRKLIFALLLFSACGQNPETLDTQTSVLTASCSGLHVGRYGRLPVPTEIIELRADCSGEFLQGGQTVQLTYSLQGAQAHYTLSDGRQWVCNYAATGLTLTLNCGAGNIQYGLNAF